MNEKYVDIIGAAESFGAPFEGAEKGPDSIRQANLFGALKNFGIPVRDLGDISPDPALVEFSKRTEALADKEFFAAHESLENLKNLRVVLDVNSRLYNGVLNSLQGGNFPVVLGGDHSIAAGSGLAASDFSGGCGIIWVDAHGDFNDEIISPSGNIHGMPLSALTGFGPSQILPQGAKHVLINPKHAVLIGARDLDPKEAVKLKMAGVTVFSAADVHEKGMESVVSEALKIATNGKKQKTWLSFDIDALDCTVAPGVSTPVTGGLTLAQAFHLCEFLKDNGFLLGADVVELNPLRDKDNITAKIAVELIRRLG